MKEFTAHNLLFAGMFFFTTASLPVQADTIAKDRALELAARQAGEYLEGARRYLGAPGMNVAVAFNGELVWSRSFGVADHDLPIPMRTDTPMPVGSISKVLTAMGAAVAVDRGLLDPNAPVQRYVPEFPEKRGTITARLLAGHMAGIRSYAPADLFTNPDFLPAYARVLPFDRQSFADVHDALALFENDPLLFEPGEDMEYTPFGPVLLSAVIQGAAKQPFPVFMDEALFDPLGMEQTSVYRHSTCVEFCARGHELRGFQVREVLFRDISYKWAGGGFVSTADDLARFGAGMLNDTALFPPHILRMAFTLQRAENGEMTYAWNWLPDVEAPYSVLPGHPAMYHNGGVLGHSAHLRVFYQDNLVVAVTENTQFWGEAVRNQFVFLPVGVAAIFLDAIERSDKLTVEEPLFCRDGGCSDEILRRAEASNGSG